MCCGLDPVVPALSLPMGGGIFRLAGGGYILSYEGTKPLRSGA